MHSYVFKSAESVRDMAMLNRSFNVKSAHGGGIDLNQINLNREGKKVVVRFDPAQFNELMRNGFSGFMPVITNVEFIKNPWPLLGVLPRKEEEQFAKI